MARHGARSPAEHDAPRQVGGTAPQLAVHEVRKPPEEEPDGGRHAAQVGQREVRDARHLRRRYAGEERAHEPAVEAHAAVVEREHLERVLQVELQAVAVEQHVSQPSARHDADDDAEHDGEQRVGVHADAPALGQPPDEQGGAHEPRHVGDAVPPHGERPRREQDGVEIPVDIVEHRIPLPCRSPELRRRRENPPRAGPPRRAAGA